MVEKKYFLKILLLLFNTMEQFSIYLQTGFEHIADWKGYDHILFVVALCATYLVDDWKKILILVTAFTIGHSFTLALASLQIIVFEAEIIEFLIPITIFCTAIFNFFVYQQKTDRRKYALAIFFGLIHGLGFSNYLSALLGKESDILIPLLSFNVGLEIGQLIIVGITLIFSQLFIGLLGVKPREWNLVISGAIAGISLVLLSEKWIF